MNPVLDTDWTFPLPADRDDVGWVIVQARRIHDSTRVSMEHAVLVAAQLMSSQKIARGMEQIKVELNKITDELSGGKDVADALSDIARSVSGIGEAIDAAASKDHIMDSQWVN